MATSTTILFYTSHFFALHWQRFCHRLQTAVGPLNICAEHRLLENLASSSIKSELLNLRYVGRLAGWLLFLQVKATCSPMSHGWWVTIRTSISNLSKTTRRRTVCPFSGVRTAETTLEVTTKATVEVEAAPSAGRNVSSPVERATFTVNYGKWRRHNTEKPTKTKTGSEKKFKIPRMERRPRRTGTASVFFRRHGYKRYGEMRRHPAAAVIRAKLLCSAGILYTYPKGRAWVQRRLRPGPAITCPRAHAHCSPWAVPCSSSTWQGTLDRSSFSSCRLGSCEQLLFSCCFRWCFFAKSPPTNCAIISPPGRFALTYKKKTTCTPPSCREQ